MRLYEYRCRRCRDVFDGEYGLEVYPHLCADGQEGETVRVFKVNVQRSSLKPFATHYNPTVGRAVTSAADMQRALDERAATETAQTGIEHSYAIADLRDKEVFGSRSINESALKATYDAHAPESPVRQAITGMIDS